MDQNSGFGSKFRIWIKIQDLDQNSGFGSKFRIWIKIQDMDENSGYVSIFNRYLYCISIHNTAFMYDRQGQWIEIALTTSIRFSVTYIYVVLLMLVFLSTTTRRRVAGAAHF